MDSSHVIKKQWCHSIMIIKCIYAYTIVYTIYSIHIHTL